MSPRRPEPASRPGAARTAGFDTLPQRPLPLTLVLLAVVIGLSAGAATLFKESAFRVVDALSGAHDAAGAARRLGAAGVTVLCVGAVVLAAAAGAFAARRWPQRSGLDAVAAAARGGEVPISLPATLVRGAGTWLMVVGLVPIGRESAIIETGGAIGSSIARRFHGHGATMATAGIAAAFATAYHAPIASFMYLQEHLRVLGSRRATLFGLAGAAGGHLVATRLLGAHAILPALHGRTGSLSVAAAIAVVPAALAARVLREARTRLQPRAGVGRVWVRVGATASVAAAVVLVAPYAAGNGMDALRAAAAARTGLVGLALAMAAAKLLGTVAVVASGAPGGALTPTMSVAAGTALLVLVAVRGLVSSADRVPVWGVVVFAGAVAVAVGLRAPLTAVFLLPEMMGRPVLVPAVAAAVAVGMLVDRVAGALVGRAAAVRTGSPGSGARGPDTHGAHEARRRPDAHR